MSIKMSAPVLFPNPVSADVVDGSLYLSRMVASARLTPTHEKEDFNKFIRLKKVPPDASNEDTRDSVAFTRIAPSPSPEKPLVQSLRKLTFRRAGTLHA